MARGQRSAFDSVAGQTKAFQVIKNPIHPTRTLTNAGQTYFNRIISSRERSTWNELDIHTATQLAITLAQIDDLYDYIEEHGWLQTNFRGVEVRHPAATQLDRLYAIETRLVQTLGLTAGLRCVTGKEQGLRNRTDKQVQDTVDRADGSDGILA